MRDSLIYPWWWRSRRHAELLFVTLTQNISSRLIFDLYTFCIYEAAAAAVVASFTETNASAFSLEIPSAHGISYNWKEGEMKRERETRKTSTKPLNRVESTPATDGRTGERERREKNLNCNSIVLKYDNFNASLSALFPVRLS